MISQRDTDLIFEENPLIYFPPDFVERLLKGAKALAATGKYDEATGIYNFLITCNPNLSEKITSSAAFFELSKAKLKSFHDLSPDQHRKTKIDIHARTFSGTAKDAQSAQAAAKHCMLAEEMIMQNPDLAIEHFTSAIQLNSGDYQSLLGRGMLYGASNRFDLAFTDLDKANKISKTMPIGYILRATLHCQVSNYFGAMGDTIIALLVDWTRAIDIQSVNQVTFKISIAQIKEYEKRWTSPTKTLKEYIAIAREHMAKDEIPSAVRFFTYAIAEGIKRSLPREQLHALFYERSVANFKLQKYNDALYDLSVAMWWNSPKFVNPDTLNIQPYLTHLRLIYIYMGNPLGAVRTHLMIKGMGTKFIESLTKKSSLESSIQALDVEFSLELLRKAKEYIAEGYFDNAEEFLSRAIEYGQKNIEAYVDMGFLCCQVGRFQDAKIAIDTALKLDPKNVRALASLDLIKGELKLEAPAVPKEDKEQQRKEQRLERLKKGRKKKKQAQKFKSQASTSHSKSDQSTFTEVLAKEAAEKAKLEEFWEQQLKKLPLEKKSTLKNWKKRKRQIRNQFQRSQNEGLRQLRLIK